MLSIKDLYVSYGGIKALRGINLEVPDGKIVTLIGANGGIKVNVKPLLLTYTSLIDPVKETVLDVAAKSNVTFTFDAALTGYTAEYKLIDATGATVETDEAAIAGQTVTVQSDKMVIDNDNANTTTRTTAYEIVLTIKDADDKVDFSKMTYDELSAYLEQNPGTELK